MGWQARLITSGVSLHSKTSTSKEPNMRQGIKRMTIVSVAAVVALLSACTAAPADSNTVTIGLSAGFSGPTAYLGQDAQRGIELAIDDLNADGSGLTWKLKTADDECSPEGGANAFGQLADIDNVDVILGSPCSGSALGGKPVLGRSSVPGLSFGASNSAITADAGVGGAKYQWRMNIDDAVMGEAFAKLIAEEGHQKLSILAVNNDFGRGAAELYSKFLPEVGVDVVSTEVYEYEAADMRPQLTKIASQNVDALLFFGEAPTCALALRNMSELGFDKPLFARSACTTVEALGALSDPTLADGVVEVNYWSGTDDQTMIARFEEKFGEYPAYNSAMAYYATMVVAQAVEAGGTGREGIQSGLSKVDWASPIGPIKFDDHNQAHHDMFVVTVENGEIRLLDQVATQGSK